MNRILPILLLCLGMAACKEERLQCWNCSYTYSGNLPDSTGDTTLCNLTKTDIEIRQDKAFDGGAAGYKSWTITNCKEK